MCFGESVERAPASLAHRLGWQECVCGEARVLRILGDSAPPVIGVSHALESLLSRGPRRGETHFLTGGGGVWIPGATFIVGHPLTTPRHPPRVWGVFESSFEHAVATRSSFGLKFCLSFVIPITLPPPYSEEHLRGEGGEFLESEISVLTLGTWHFRGEGASTPSASCATALRACKLVGR